MRNSTSLGAEPDILEWSDRVALNPGRIPPEYGGSPGLDDAVARLRTHAGAGMTRLAQLSEPSPG